jgi:ribosome recycling factor
MIIIEKQVMAFFKILLKEFEKTSAQEGNQKLIQSQLPCPAYNSERLTKLKKEIEELCEQRKSDLSEIAYTLHDQIQNKTSRVYKQSTLEKSK